MENTSELRADWEQLSNSHTLLTIIERDTWGVAHKAETELSLPEAATTPPYKRSTPRVQMRLVRLAYLAEAFSSPEGRYEQHRCLMRLTAGTSFSNVQAPHYPFDS